MHLGAGMLISLVFSALFSPLWGFVAAGVAGVAKEGSDYYLNKRDEAAGKEDEHDVDPWDYVYTQLGGGVTSLIIYALNTFHVFK